MKNLLITTAAIMALASSASALTLGNGFSAGGEVKTAYTVDAEDMTTTVTPKISYNLDMLTVTVSSDLSVWNNGWVGDDTFKVYPTIDFEAVIAAQKNLEFMLETSYDLEADTRSEMTLSATLSF